MRHEDGQAVDERLEDLTRTRQDEIGHLQYEAEDLPQAKEGDDEGGGPEAAAQCIAHGSGSQDCGVGAGIDDEFAQALVERDEIMLEGHLNGAGAMEIDRAVINDATGPCAHDADT
ncbi:hypothetical protein D3C78_1111440 [compost metagenome]